MAWRYQNHEAFSPPLRVSGFGQLELNQRLTSPLMKIRESASATQATARLSVRASASSSVTRPLDAHHVDSTVCLTVGFSFLDEPATCLSYLQPTVAFTSFCRSTRWMPPYLRASLDKCHFNLAFQSKSQSCPCSSPKADRLLFLGREQPASALLLVHGQSGRRLPAFSPPLRFGSDFSEHLACFN